LISLASPTQWGAPSFLAQGGCHERIRNGVRAKRTKVASTASLPAPSTSSGLRDRLRAGSCKKRKDGAPSAGMVHAKIIEAGLPA
jgi:hypothetical protein